MVCRMLDKTREPTIENPDDGTADDTRKVRCLIDAVCVSSLVEKHAGYNLQRINQRDMRNGKSRTWCMPKNSARTRIMPVYHGSSVKVMNMR